MKAKSTTQRLRSSALFTIVGGVVVINPAFAQQPATSPVASQTKSETLEEVVVTGLRASLEASMDISVTRSAWSTRLPPRTWASSPTRTWPSRCSESPASPSTAATARARRSPLAASDRSSTW